MENIADQSILIHIKELTEKEVRLYGRSDLSEDDVEELHAVRSELDQNWDFLRQRRAFRDAGEDPERAIMRSKDTIKHYKA